MRCVYSLEGLMQTKHYENNSAASSLQPRNAGSAWARNPPTAIEAAIKPTWVVAPLTIEPMTGTDRP